MAELVDTKRLNKITTYLLSKCKTEYWLTKTLLQTATILNPLKIEEDKTIVVSFRYDLKIKMKQSYIIL